MEAYYTSKGANQYYKITHDFNHVFFKQTKTKKKKTTTKGHFYG